MILHYTYIDDLGRELYQQSLERPDGSPIPPNAYNDKLPQPKENHRIMRVNRTKWRYLPDYKNTWYHKITRETKTWELGEKPNSNYTDIEPLKNIVYQTFDDTENVWRQDLVSWWKERLDRLDRSTKAKLEELDLRKVRPLSAMLAATTYEEASVEQAFLDKLNEQTVRLRTAVSRLDQIRIKWGIE